MSFTIVHKVQVENFDTWLNPDPNAVEEMMKGQGAQSVILLRNVADPNAIMIYTQFADENAAKAFDAWYKNAIPEWEKQGYSKQEIQESWIGEVIESHSFTLT